jgi:hypothetical protein
MLAPGAMIRVELLSRELEDRYRNFLAEDPQALVYASLEFRDFLSLAVGGTATYLVALDDLDRLVGVLPFFSFEAPEVGTVINSLPWYGSHGGCTVAGPSSRQARRALLEGFVSHVGSARAISATIVLSPVEQSELQEYDSVLKPTAYDSRIGQMTRLPEGASVQELEGTLTQKTRNLVRKSLKQSFALHYEDDDASWRFLWETHAENMIAIGAAPKPWAHFCALRSAIPSRCRRLLVARHGGVPVAGLLLLYFNRTVEYVTPVIKREYRSLQPLSFLIWNGMLDAMKFGYKWWNWGGTWVNQHSLHHFKAGWGAADMPYTYLVKSSSEGRKKLMQHKQALGARFPYYYTYPYSALA